MKINLTTYIKRYFLLVPAILLLAIYSRAGYSAVIDSDIANLILSGKFESAQTKLSVQLADASRAKTALVTLTEIAIDTGNIEKALNYTDQFLELTPLTAREFKVAGDSHCAKAQQSSIFKALMYAKRCINYYDQAVALDKKNIDALVAATSYHLSAPGVAGGSDSIAEEYLAMLDELSPEHADTLRMERLHGNEDLEAARKLAARLTNQGFRSVRNQYKVAKFYRDQGEYAKALTLFEPLTKTSGSYEDRWYYTDSFLQTGEIYLRENIDIKKSIEYLETYKRRNQNVFDPHYYWSTWRLAQAYRAAGNQDDYNRLVKQIKKENYTSNKAFAREFKKELRGG